MSTILVADDESGVREFFSMMLRNEGYRVLEASNVPDCVLLAVEEAPDLILLDWMMPDVDGVDALRILKSSEPTRSIPVVMVTALSGLSNVRLATDVGADAYLTKPVESSDLLSVVERFTQPRPASATS